MENLTELLDDMSQLQYNEEEQKRLEAKLGPKTQVEINEPFYKYSLFTRRLIQALSITSGIGVSLYFGEKFPDLFWIIFGGALIILASVEYAIEMSLEKANAVRIQNKTRTIKINAKIYSVALAPLMMISASASFIGWPVVVDQLSTHEQLSVLDSVRAEFLTGIAANEFRFAAQKKNLQDQITDIDTSMRWRGIIIEEAQGTYAKLQSELSEKDKELNAENRKIQDAMGKAVAASVAQNKEILKEHKKFCSNFGWIAACSSVVLYGLLLLLSLFISNHEEGKRRENKNKAELEKRLKEAHKDGVKQPVKEKEKTFEEPPIKYLLSDGTEKITSIGKFMSYVKASAEGRKKELYPFFAAYYQDHYFDSKEAIQNKLDNYLLTFPKED